MNRFYEQQSDLCPVCREMHTQPGQVYCSEACRISAYNYRKRLADSLRFLTEVGFTHSYVNGVQLTIKLPGKLANYYPGGMARFSWPYPPREIDTINADDLWLELQRQLGDKVALFVKWLFETGNYHGALLWDLVSIFVKSVYETDHFHCPHCNREYIPTVESYDLHNRLCCDCSVMAIPF